MKASCLLLVLAFPAVLLATNPVSKVIQLLTDLEAKISAEGAAAKTEYTEFVAWCEDHSRDLAFEIKTGKATSADLNAKIDETSAAIDSLNTKLEELAGNLATDEADLKAATHIRAKEAADFKADDAELQEAVDTLERAIRILEREAQKGGASMLQMNNVQGIAQALSVMVEASAISAADSVRLTALVQTSQEGEDVGAPDSAVYQSHSGDIIGVMQGILDKAQAQLSALRHTENKNLNNFQLLQQSIEDEIKFGKKDMDDAKKGLAANAEAKAGAEGDLAVTTKDLNGDIAALEDTQRDCMDHSQEYETSLASRTEELKALADAKKILIDTTGGADTIAYGLTQVSFLQTKLSSGKDLANFEAVRYVRDLARKQNSAALTQLASRMSSAVQFGTETGGDVFAKVKGLIADMIIRLESEADADATHKAFCDKHLAETREKKADKTAEIQKLSTKIDQMSARSAQLKEEIAGLNKALADLHASQKEMDKMRAAENAAFIHDKAEMEEGLQGVKMALKVLRDYYAQKTEGDAVGAAGGIVGLLEVVESDFTKNLAELIASEGSAQAEYEQQTKDNQIEQANKEQDLKYKTKEATGLDKAVVEATSDRSGVQSELDATLEYLSKLVDQCIEKAETYEDRKSHRAAEIAGLHEALEILEGETAFLQQATRKVLRGRN